MALFRIKTNNKQKAFRILNRNDKHFNFDRISDELKNDQEFMLKAVESLKFADVLQYASENLKNNEEFMLKMLDITYCCIKLGLEHASEKLKNSENFILSAVKVNYKSLEYASDELRNNKEFVLKAIEINAKAILGASDELQNNEDVVLKALALNGSILQGNNKFGCDLNLANVYSIHQAALKYGDFSGLNDFSLSFFRKERNMEFINEFVKNTCKQYANKHLNDNNFDEVNNEIGKMLKQAAEIIVAKLAEAEKTKDVNRDDGLDIINNKIASFGKEEKKNGQQSKKAKQTTNC